MLILHTALHAEARAFIEHFRLQRQHDLKTFACFARDDIFLVESGMGKIDTATAIGWAGALLAAEQPVWLNIGMAGHADHQLGHLLLAHRIEDQASEERYYPPQLFHPVPSSENLITVEQPSHKYPANAMIDMEASAFIRSASRFSSLELIHSIKLITDNRENPPVRMKAAAVESMFSPHVEQVAQIAQQLLQLRQLAIDLTRETQEIIRQRWHFSQYQRSQLKRLIQRYHALYKNQPLLDKIPDNVHSGKHFIQWLDDTLANVSFNY